jgi:hypothetical protein
MASEILGLFGGQNPQQLRNAALDSMLVSPAQMSSQGLLQQVVSMGRNAGTVAGMGAGRLMGGKVAGEVEASYLEQAIQAGQAGKTPTEKMKLVASFLEDKPGMGAQYMKALSEASRLEAEDFTMAQAKEKARTKVIESPVTMTDPITGKPTVVNTRRTVFDNGKRDAEGRVIWEERDGSAGTPPPPPAGGSGTPESALDVEAKRRAAEKAGQTQGGATTTTAMPGSVNDFVGASTSNIDMAALEKQAQADRANAAYEAEAKEISSLYQLTPAVIAGLTRQQAIAAFRKYKKNLTKEQTDAILAKAGARRTQFR